MSKEIAYQLLVDLAAYLQEGEQVRVSQKTASLVRWGRVIGLGFKGVATHLATRKHERHDHSEGRKSL